MNQLMDDKVVVVTGASSGIGQATMALLCAEGAKVVGSARNQSRLDEAIKTVNDVGGTAIGIAADMSDDEQVGRLVDAAVAEFGRIDVLINNAGVGYSYRAQRPDSMNAIAVTMGATTGVTRAVLERINGNKSQYLGCVEIN